MDPITLLLIASGAAAAAGLGAAAGPLWRHSRLRRARELVTRPIVGSQAGGGSARSVFEVFEELGASEYALEVMRHMDLIPESEADVERVSSAMADAISSYGGYEPMMASLRETIRELHVEGGLGGRAGRLTLVAPRGKDSLLPAFEKPAQLEAGEEVRGLPARGETGSEGDEDRGEGGSPAAGERAPAELGAPPAEAGPTGRLHATVDQALEDIFSRGPKGAEPPGGASGAAAVVIGGILGSLTTGGFWDGVSRFVQQRRLSQMRTRLAQELAGLSLDLYHAPAEVQARVDRNLEAFLLEARWQVERHRREAARHRKLPREQRSTTQLAMKLLASKKARTDLGHAERDVKRLGAEIRRHRRSGRHDLAGFLIYVNRDALLRDVGDYAARLAAIEEAGDQLRRAMLAEPPAAQR